MAKLATRAPKPPTGFTATIGQRPASPDLVTHEGGSGWSRDAKSELFMLAVTNLVSEDTFYEKAGERDERFEQLIAQVAAEDPDWVARFVPYLRNTMNLRSASIVMAAELVHARLGWQNKGATPPVGKSNRQIVDSAIVRADEPAEFVGYWRSRFGKSLPMPVKRGVADAVARLYNERAFIKYGAGETGYRMADVLDLVHPTPKAPWQAALFHAILDARHPTHPANPEVDETVLAQLPSVTANRAAMALDQAAFRAAFSAEFVDTAGLTWEQASSKYGKLDAAFWQAMIPNMGIFAHVRNLRNFEEAGIDAAAKAVVETRLTDAEAIAKSRMLPLRFYSAWANTGTMTWGPALETALGHSLANIPSLPGKTLVLVDVSGSMDDALSTRSKASRWQVAALFGTAIALRAEKATLVSFETNSREVFHHKVGSILRIVDEVKRKPGESGGTNTWQAVARHYDNHDRVIIVTDEQAFPYGAAGMIPAGVGTEKPLYTFNVAGYKAAYAPTGEKRYAFGGLTDGAFTALALIERGADASWPF